LYGYSLIINYRTTAATGLKQTSGSGHPA